MAACLEASGHFFGLEIEESLRIGCNKKQNYGQIILKAWHKGCIKRMKQSCYENVRGGGHAND